MPLIPDPPFPKTQGDNIRSKDWNDVVNELIRLDNAKANRSGAEAFTGPLTIDGAVGIGTTTPARLLHVQDSEMHSGGSKAGLSFGNRTAAGFTEVPANGERWVWYASGSTARLWSGSDKFTFDLSGRLQADKLQIGPWPANAVYQMVGVSTLDQTQAGNYALLQGALGFDIGTTYVNSPKTLHLRTNNTDRAVFLGDGTAQVTGPLQLGNSDLYFTNTAHSHTGFGNTTGFAAIENAANFGALMILGRQVTGTGRVVKLWDQLEVNGRFTTVNGGMNIAIGVPSGPYANDGIRGTPNLWLDAANTVFIKQGFQARGMDVAERFPLHGTALEGEVVVYDEALGAVRRCERAGDPTAVGIVSEAPAMLIGLGSGEVPIALCGRVPCWVDADIAPVQAGDLLVTSPTPGHAQKQPAGASASGRVVGKALESLAAGRGRILALVLTA